MVYGKGIRWTEMRKRGKCIYNGKGDEMIPKKFYILMTLEKAFRQWRISGKRCNFGTYCRTLEALGYRILFALLLLTGTASASQREYSTVEVADAIFMAEGGTNAAYWYGIRSVKYRDLADAQKICMRTIRHSRTKWIKAGKPGDFIAWLGRTYCPISAAAVNKHWVRNVHWFIDHKNTRHNRRN